MGRSTQLCPARVPHGGAFLWPDYPCAVTGMSQRSLPATAAIAVAGGDLGGQSQTPGEKSRSAELKAPDFSKGSKTIRVFRKPMCGLLQSFQQAHDLFQLAHLGYISGRHFSSLNQITKTASAAFAAMTSGNTMYLRMKFAQQSAGMFTLSLIAISRS